MTHAWDRCGGLHWTRGDTAAALGHGRTSPAAESVKLFDRRLSLDALAVQVAGHEILIGPLVALAVTARGTAATFARAAPPPLRAQLRRSSAGAVPGGCARVCEGTAWIEGGPASILAIRRNMD